MLFNDIHGLGLFCGHPYVLYVMLIQGQEPMPWQHFHGPLISISCRVPFFYYFLLWLRDQRLGIYCYLGTGSMDLSIRPRSDHRPF